MSWGLEAEARYLSGIRSRYEAEGYTFHMYPHPSLLPAFMGSYRPDAIATKAGSNLAIEVKSRQTPSAERSIEQIRRLFEGQADWRLAVVFSGEEPSPTIAVPRPEDVRKRLAEVKEQAAVGQLRSAFVMAWSLLEATLRAAERNSAPKPRTPATVAQALAMLGLIDPKTELDIRSLIDLRNSIVHGDVTAEPTLAQVHSVIGAIEQALEESETT